MFNIIDINTWERKPYFDHYNNKDHCSYSLTANIDITNLITFIKENNYRFYPSFIYVVTNAVNTIKEFKISLDKENRLGYYDMVSASYIIFHEDDKTFSCAFTEYCENFNGFYKSITSDMDKYKNVKGFRTIESQPNSFPVSCLPWLNYSSLNLNLPLDGNFYAPIITWGKYEQHNDIITIPLTVQINHAVADGYHSSMFFKRVTEICKSPEKFL